MGTRSLHLRATRGLLFPVLPGSLVVSFQGSIPQGGSWRAGIHHPGLAQPLQAGPVQGRGGQELTRLLTHLGSPWPTVQDPPSKSIQCLHVDSEGSKVMDGCSICRVPTPLLITHTHIHPSPSPPNQSLIAQVGLFLWKQTFRVWNLPWSSSSTHEGKMGLKSHRSEC